MKCEICGKEIKESMYMNAILCSDACFTKHFWKEHLDDKAIIINGTCYHLGEESDTSYFRGFGGARYYILMNDGTKKTSTNLWCNGTIPKEFYTGDNAKFISEKEYNEL